MNSLAKPGAQEIAAYYAGYIALCPESDLFTALEGASLRFRHVVGGIPESKGGHRYADGKWSIKEVIQHLIDCERIFAYRALRFARNDGQELHGFDENAYAPEALADRRTLGELIAEQEAVRSATVLLFRSFSGDMLLRAGCANGNPFSVRALGWAIAGHEHHHLNVIEQRYL